MIDYIKSAGYRVFIRPGSTTYCFYTDGIDIAYAQWGRGQTRISSVHKPNQQSGTGFSLGETINLESLKNALTCHAPHWASAADRRSIKKYASFEAFHKSSTFNSELVEV